MFLLRNRATKRFAADAWQKTDAHTRQQLEKLKRQWHAEWEEERRRNAPSPDAIRASIDRKIAEMRALVEAEKREQEARALPAPDADGDEEEGEEE